MTPARWQQVEALYHAADALSGDERRRFLDDRCNGDAELRASVERLLSVSDTDPQFLENSVLQVAEQAVAGRAPGQGDRIGAYEIVRPIGEGGMGTVYLARRVDREYHQQVAIKVIRAHSGMRRALSRFRSERQILAHLVHPNVARLLDGGVTPQGDPYFVMEYVEGLPIDRYCRAHDLPLRRRLDIFLALCAGVQCAHQNLVVHRDIKPANILVTADGTPKLLDFGIAKLLAPLEGDTAEPLTQTQMTERLMTPEYASPEQLLGQPITTATDVYALGIVLYELLTGKRPFVFVERTPGEMERIICHQDPVRPSAAAAGPSGTVTRLRQELRGDLDNIVLKAMQKDPARRYAGAAELAADVQRYLTGFAVTARGDTIGYRAGKFIRRHPVPVAASALLLVTIAGFAIGMALLAREARAERDRAERVSDFLVGLFSNADPENTRGRDMTAREMLDQGVRQIPKLNAEPKVQARLLNTLGLVYENLGSYQRSREVLEQALATKRQVYGTGSLEVAETLKNVAELARRGRDFPAAEAWAREALAIRLRHLGEQNVLVPETRNTLALVEHGKGDLREAERLFLQVLERRAVLRQRPHLETAVLSNLGGLYKDLGEYAKGERYLRECIEIRRRELGGAHPRLALALGKLADLLQAAGRLDEAFTVSREALDMRRKVFRGSHPDIGRSLQNLAVLERLRGRYAESEAYLDQAAAAFLGSGDNEATAAVHFERGQLREAEGRLPEAARLIGEALRMRTARTGERNLLVARTQLALGRVLLAQGKRDDARSQIAAGFSALETMLPPGHQDLAKAAELRQKAAQP